MKNVVLTLERKKGDSPESDRYYVRKITGESTVVFGRYGGEEARVGDHISEKLARDLGSHPHVTLSITLADSFSRGVR